LVIVFTYHGVFFFLTFTDLLFLLPDDRRAKPLPIACLILSG